MNYEEPGFVNNMKSFKNMTFDRNGNSNSLETFDDLANKNKTSEIHAGQRLQELESINANLENLVEIFSKKLTEVVASNAKYLSIVAHDLRSPFASVLAVMKDLKDNLRESDVNETEKNIDLAYAAASKTINLLDNLLPWAILQSKEMSFNPVKINLNELFASEIESISISARQKHLFLNCSVATDLNVTADLQMVKTILRNLISNAIKFTGPGGEISLGASESKPFVEIVVRDTGTGISYETQGKLFKIDALHSTPGTNNEQGTGLGLLLCKEFVELHGGKIWIESEPGKGTKFKFTLPRYI